MTICSVCGGVLSLGRLLGRLEYSLAEAWLDIVHILRRTCHGCLIELGVEGWGCLALKVGHWLILLLSRKGLVPNLSLLAGRESCIRALTLFALGRDWVVVQLSMDLLPAVWLSWRRDWVMDVHLLLIISVNQEVVGAWSESIIQFLSSFLIVLS